jgi:Na+/melibiose symporter-like transporter
MLQSSQSDAAIKKVVIVGGLVLMLICFTLVLVFNVDDTEDHDQIVAFTIAICGIIFFGTILFLYVRFQLRKSRAETNESDLERSEEVSSYLLNPRNVIKMIKCHNG